MAIVRRGDGKNTLMQEMSSGESQVSVRVSKGREEEEKKKKEYRQIFRYTEETL